ncbi:hypothetical protein RGQ29_013740 [Quercus rubra]|uniref:INO80 complex subunit B-like conserved region domain-containing protein n=1 Tax=Quercus rubra TaxID=3512 RepID=A0AAN7IZQ1_QUERU|nr:hypothetical protein RGQ29_013740 [Quercus rubra]
MEGFGSFGLSDKSSAVRKKRSNASRRLRNDSLLPSDYHDVSPLSSTPPSDNVSKVSSDENNEYGSVSRKKELNLNQCTARASSVNIGEAESGQNMIKNEDGGFGESDEASNNGSFRGSNEHIHSGVESKRHSEGVLAPADWKGKSKMEPGVGSSATKASRISDAGRLQPKFIGQDISDDKCTFTSEKGSGLRGLPWKDFSKYGLNVGKANSSRSRMPEENISTNQVDKYEPIRKSKRISKRCVLDEDDDDEIKYLEKLRTPKATVDYGVEYEDDEEGGSRKQRKISRVLKSNVDGRYDVNVKDHLSSRSGKDGKRSRSERVFEDTDYVEDEDPISDVTTRQRALQTGKDVSSSFGASLIEFPNGLPPAPPRKQKEILSEVEQQLKRAEALQRRRMQVEKAARESEAEAIRKILGQDSSRKKREDKMKKRQEELAQEKAANYMVLASDSVRWVIGPSGTVVTFPNEIGLPTLFSKPCS